MQSHDKGRTYKVIKTEIEKLGYIVKEKIFNTMQFTNLPQTRERIYIACFRDIKDADNFKMFDELDKFMSTKDKENWAENVKKLLTLLSKLRINTIIQKKKYPHYFITEKEYELLPDKDKKRDKN